MKYEKDLSVTAKGIDDDVTMAHPMDETDIFSILDPEAYSLIRIKDMAGSHNIRWEWLKPGGAPYYRTKNSTIDIADGTYREYVTAWNSIPIHGGEPAMFPGKWTVNVYVDNKEIASDKFTISDIDVDKFPGVVQSPDSNKFGLVIGIEKYSNLPEVKYAKRDAMMFKEYLMKSVGVPEQNIFPPLLDDGATKGDLEGMLTSYLPKNLPKTAVLYIYYSGHGYTTYDNNKNVYLVTYEGNPKYIDTTGYKLDKFYQDVDALNIKQAVVFIDSCFSGAVPNTMKNKMVDPSKFGLIEVNVEDNISSLDKVISLNSSTGSQVSLPYDDKKHSLFSYFLFKGLCGTADTDGDNEVTLHELYTYTKKNVDLVSRRMKGSPQTPVIIPSLDQVKDFTMSQVVR